MELKKKELYFEEFSKTMKLGDHQFLSFYQEISLIEEFELLFDKIIKNYGSKHFGIYRMCDGEYMFCVGRRLRKDRTMAEKIKFVLKDWLISAGIINEKIGHINEKNKEIWFGENYSLSQKKKSKKKFISDLRQIGEEGFLAPHLVYSKERFAEEYIIPILKFFEKNKIGLNKENYFPFYFVYFMLSVERYKKILYSGKNVLIITNFNERSKKENFIANLAPEGVKNIYFYNISHDKSMLEVIDKSKLPQKVDLVLIGAGIGSTNIITQLKHLNALCIDAGHALDCISRPQLRIERICLLPDKELN